MLACVKGFACASPGASLPSQRFSNAFTRCLPSVHYCGGRTPSLLTCTRVATTLPSLFMPAAM
jgi:hypothetical protein